MSALLSEAVSEYEKELARQPLSADTSSLKEALAATDIDLTSLNAELVHNAFWAYHYLREKSKIHDLLVSYLDQDLEAKEEAWANLFT